MKKITAIVPMRHNSERVPGKNYRDFAGKPLYHRVVDSLLACDKIAEVVIDTDSPTILEDASKHFPSVRLFERPEHLRAGEVPMNDVLLNTISQLDADFFLQTHSTNPLLSAKTVSDGVHAFLENYPIHDSLFTVTRLQTRLWDPLARAINHNPNILLRVIAGTTFLISLLVNSRWTGLHPLQGSARPWFGPKLRITTRGTIVRYVERI